MAVLEQERRALQRTCKRLHKNIEKHLSALEGKVNGQGFDLSEEMEAQLDLYLRTVKTLANVRDTQNRELKILGNQLTEQHVSDMLALLKRMIFQDIDNEVKPGIEQELIDELTSTPLRLASGVNPTAFAKHLAVVARRPVIQHRSKLLTAFMSDDMLGRYRHRVVECVNEAEDETDA